MKTLRPVEVSEFYIKQVASGMAQYFWGYLFAPIYEILKEPIDNSKDDLIKAIQSGRIWYENGSFKTKDKFSNKVAQTLEELGARLVRGSYKLERTKIPTDVLSIINITRIRAIDKATRISEFLGSMLPLLETLTVRDFIEISVQKMFKKLEVDIVKSAQEFKLPVIELGIVSPKVLISKTEQRQLNQYWDERENRAKRLRQLIDEAKSPEVKKQLRDELRRHQIESYRNAPNLKIDISKFELNKVSEEVARDYVYNMNFWIKKWEVKDIIQMRKDIADMVQKGVRVPQLAEYIEKHWKIAKRKANFLALNESNLAGSVIQATQYQKLGCTKFKWGRSTSKEKRELHRQYYDREWCKANGKEFLGDIFEFANPPIIDEKLGIKGLPRQIWNCKCQMLCVPPDLEDLIKKVETVKNAKSNIFGYIKYRIENNKQLNNRTWRYRRLG